MKRQRHVVAPRRALTPGRHVSRSSHRPSSDLAPRSTRLAHAQQRTCVVPEMPSVGDYLWTRRHTQSRESRVTALEMPRGKGRRKRLSREGVAGGNRRVKRHDTIPVTGRAQNAGGGKSRTGAQEDHLHRQVAQRARASVYLASPWSTSPNLEAPPPGPPPSPLHPRRLKRPVP